MELDGYCPSLRLAFEHQGEQHYSEDTLFARNHGGLEKRIHDDVWKKELCDKHGILLIAIAEIPTRTSIDQMKNLIKAQLVLHKRPIPNSFDEIQVDLSKAYTTYEFNEHFKILNQIAREKGGECLSLNYKGNHVRLLWKCNKCGHTWLATPASIKSGTWCDKCGRKEGTRKRKLGIEKMREVAASQGGKCLSEEYINANTALKWECAKGHQWLATPHSVKNSGTWCNFCKNTDKKGAVMDRIDQIKSLESLIDRIKDPEQRKHAMELLNKVLEAHDEKTDLEESIAELERDIKRLKDEKEMKAERTTTEPWMSFSS